MKNRSAMNPSFRFKKIHRFSLALSITAWVIAVAGYAFSICFVSEMADLRQTLMARSIFVALGAIGGWWVSIAAFAISIVVACFTPKSRTLVAALFLSGIYSLSGAFYYLHGL